LQIFRICTTILRTWNQAVLDAWSLLYNEIIQKIPYSDIAKESEDTLLSLSEQSQHTMSKYIAAKIIGYIAEVLFSILTISILNRIKSKILAYSTIEPRFSAKTLIQKSEE